MWCLAQQATPVANNTTIIGVPDAATFVQLRAARKATAAPTFVHFNFFHHNAAVLNVSRPAAGDIDRIRKINKGVLIEVSFRGRCDYLRRRVP